MTYSWELVEILRILLLAALSLCMVGMFIMTMAIMDMLRTLRKLHFTMNDLLGELVSSSQNLTKAIVKEENGKEESK